jgi:hypothetical protein
MKSWIAALALCAACTKGASQEQCTQLLDHLVDLEFRHVGATLQTVQQQSDLAEMKAAVQKAKSPEFLTACQDRTAKERVECALVAPDIAAVAKCDEVN